MPFSQYRATFDPETLDTLQAAFDMAWSEVAATTGVQLDQEAARKMIANRIIDAWRDHGERYPERLKAYALEGFKP